MKLSLHVMPAYLHTQPYRPVHDQPEGDGMRQYPDGGRHLPAGMALQREPGNGSQP